MPKDKFHEKIVNKRPELIGRRVWFCPNKTQALECEINDDGTISPRCAMKKKFDNARDLLSEIVSGSIRVKNDFKVPQKHHLSRCAFSTHLWFYSDATHQVSRYVDNETLPLPPKSPTLSSIDCPGFQLDSAIFQTVRCASIQVDGSCIRSRICTRTKTESATACEKCIKAKDIAKRAMKRAKQRNLVCPGVSNTLAQHTISRLQWDGDRRRFSSLVGSPRSSRSIHCAAAKKPHRLACTPCKRRIQVLRTLRRRLFQRSPNRTRQLLHSRYLTTPDKVEKAIVLERKRKTRSKTLSAKVSSQGQKIKRLKRDRSQYRPENAQIRRAVKSVKNSLEKQFVKLHFPKCEWILDGAVCAETTTTLDELGDHVLERHLRPLVHENKAVDPMMRKYYCSWTGCSRRQPFRTYKIFLRHVLLQHVGTGEQLVQYEASLCSATNIDRTPTGRRYNAAMMTLSGRNYKGRASWNRMRKVATTPLPSLSTVMAMKNAGGVRAGIDYDIITKFSRLTVDKPKMRYGILIFDEVHILPGVEFCSSNLQMFGLADDKRGEKATQLLVFQYISIFSKRRFAINVAWYACVGLTPEKLKQWFWEVVFALEVCGFTIVASVCDGSGTNRCFQDLLLGKGRKDGYSVDNKARPGHKIWILSDPSHAIKKLRNSWMSNKRCLRKGGHDISWSHMVQVRKWQQQQKRSCIRVERELTQKHLQMTSFGKMNVQMAVTVFSDPISNILSKINPLGAKGTLEFMEMCRTLWMGMNDAKRLRTYDDSEPLRLQLRRVGEYLDEWKLEIEDAIEREFAATRASRVPRSRIRKKQLLHFITRECYEDVRDLICKAVPCFLEYILNKLNPGFEVDFSPKFITQDLLERDFSKLRCMAGGGMNPTVYCAAHSLRTLNVNKLSFLEC